MTIPLDVLLSVLVPYSLVLIWLVRLEARTQSNTRGVERSDEHHKEGTNVKIDIATLTTDMGHVKEDVRAIKDMIMNGLNE